MNMDLVILGAGGFGRMIADIALQSLQYGKISFLDDYQSGQNIVGKLVDYIRYISSDIQIYPAFGDNQKRIDWLDLLEKQGADIPSFIHSTAYVSPTSKIEKGVAVFPHAVISTGCYIKKGCIINSSVVIDHDCILEEGVHISIGGLIRAENRLSAFMKVEAGKIIAAREFPI